MEDIAGRFDDAMSRAADLDQLPRQLVAEAVEAVNDLHKRALTTVVRRLREDPRGKELLFELVDEPEVQLVLAMHSIIRPDPGTLALQALEQVRPALQSHGGDVELDRIEDTVAYVRLHGACNGCSMASVTMRGTVEDALMTAVHGLTGVEVLPNDPNPAIIPLSAVTVRSSTSSTDTELSQAGWLRTVAAAAVVRDEILAVKLEPERGTAISAILVRSHGQVAAYVNVCAHQGLPLDDGLLDSDGGTLTCPWHGLCFDSDSGECLTLPGAQLQQLPVRIVDGTVWVRPET